jgi:hypothetical protein
MWVPLVETNEFACDGADYFVKRHIDNLLSRDPEIDTIILGCTHYPILLEKIRKYTPEGITLVTQGAAVAASLKDYLRRHPRVNSNMMILVRQLQPTPQGLPLELYFFSDGTAWVPYENLQSEVFEHLFAVLPQFGLRVFQAPAGTDFSSVPVQPSMVEMPKRKSVRKKKQLPDNSNTLF